MHSLTLKKEEASTKCRDETNAYFTRDSKGFIHRPRFDFSILFSLLLTKTCLHLLIEIRKVLV